MNAERALQLAVEPIVDGIAGVRVAGELTAETGPRLLRLLDDVLHRRERSGGVTRLLVDLGNVSRFEAEGVAALRRARHVGDRMGAQLLVSGVDGHREALPRRIATILAEFASVASIDTGRRGPHAAA